ncbi:hypothetical protein [Candidatus Poriferisocius sp.]|uniref:hypothetical protein n=1 Tax=Candidatus Poriferisocius sp. TaxID=3101276 RepID=UPI003B015AB7
MGFRNFSKKQAERRERWHQEQRRLREEKIRLREEKRRAKEERIAAQAAAQRNQQIREFEADVESLENRIITYRNYESIFSEIEYSHLVMKKGEELLFVMEGVGLTETRRGQTTYQGGSAGVSIRVAKGLTVRTGQHRGRVNQAPEEQALIDNNGTFVVTTQRAVYVGKKQTREFLWSKILSYQLYDWKKLILLLLPVSSRVKVSGIAMDCDEIEAEIAAERVQLGIAIFHERLDEFLEALQQLLHQANMDLAELRNSPIIVPSR